MNATDGNPHGAAIERLLDLAPDRGFTFALASEDGSLWRDVVFLGCAGPGSAVRTRRCPLIAGESLFVDQVSGPTLAVLRTAPLPKPPPKEALTELDATEADRDQLRAKREELRHCSHWVARAAQCHSDTGRHGAGPRPNALATVSTPPSELAQVQTQIKQCREQLATCSKRSLT
jgi:hypothetical protein